LSTEFAKRIAHFSRERLALLAASLNEELASARRGTVSEPVAIIGMGCRFPKAADPEAVWRLLREGVDAVTEVPPSRWDLEATYDADPEAPGKLYTRWGGFLDDVDQFDPGFFGISPREARNMDPQQRLLLEVAWEALENAGQPASRIEGSRTGVFVGLSQEDYRKALLGEDLRRTNTYSATGNFHAVASGRISYALGLQGPSISVDTACSSSLVAIHLAYESLRRRECDMALAGGVNVMAHPEITVALCKLQALSRDGRCKTFDARADGFVRSEGCGLVVLKRLSDALADRDPIVAVIRGSAINNDGKSSGLTAPNVLAQQELIRRALKSAGVEPSEIGLVETHGTGTSLGDPIEFDALKEVLGGARADASVCALGALKSNLGHMESAAGVGGLIKVALALRHEAIPANLHFRNLNPRISLEGTPFVIPTRLTPWPRGARRRVAGVSAFGISGTNVHLVVEEAPATEPVAPATTGKPGKYVLPISARTEEALKALARRYQQQPLADTRAEPGLPELSYTASVRRPHHEHRLALVGESRAELREQIAAFLAGEARPHLSAGSVELAAGRRKVVFVFPGQGSQWLGMGRGLMEREPAFRAALEQCDAAMRPHVSWSLLEELGASASPERLERVDIVQPLLFAMEVALAALWRTWGIEPDGVVGHSMGEIAAAHVAGALSLDDAARLICLRSQALLKVCGQGGMAVVELTWEQATAALSGYEERLAIAASNGPRSMVISGESRALEEVLGKLQAEGVFCRLVKVNYGSHSPQMDPLREELMRVLAGVSPRRARVPMLSTVTGRILDGTELETAYWVSNLRAPVLFSQAVEALAREEQPIFLEISPHPVLVPAIEEALARGGKSVALPSLRREEEERAVMLGTLGRMYTMGHAVDWSRLFPAGGRVVELPAYPWQRERYWGIEARSVAGAGLGRADGSHPLLGGHLELASVSGGEHSFQGELGLEYQPYLADHRMRGTPVFPGSAYLEMALSAAAEVWGPGAHRVEQVAFEEMLTVPEGSRRSVQLLWKAAGEGEASFEIYSREATQGAGASSGRAPGWRRHSAGKLRAASARANEHLEPLDAIRSRCRVSVPIEEHYRLLQEVGLECGSRFQGVAELWRGEGQALGRIRLPDELKDEARAYRIHPALLDSALQTVLATAAEAQPGTRVLLVGLEGLCLYERPPTELWAHVTRRASGSSAGDMEAELWLRDGEGRLVGEARGLRIQRVAAGRRDLIAECFYSVQWESLPQTGADAPRSPRAGPGTWLILADGGGLGEALGQKLVARGERAVIVRPGGEYRALGDGRYQLPPGDSEGFDRLLKEAFGTSGCKGVVHLWSLDAALSERAQGEALVALQQPGTESTLLLLQALSRRGWREAPRLSLVTRQVQAVGAGTQRLSVEQAPLWGLARSIVYELPELQCRCVDLELTGGAGEADSLLEELGREDEEEQVALRGGARYVARLSQRPVEATPPPSLSPAATYWITGGLGGLGLRIARWMVERGAQHLVLTGRGEPGQEALREVEALRAAGAEVRVIRADVAQAEQAARVVSEIEREMLPLRGIVHAAGVSDEISLLAMTVERLRQVMAPKVAGAWNLHVLTRERPLDFFVLCSSAIALIGSPGVGNYAAGNAFLDALAHERRRAGLPALSINWGIWGGVGLAASLGDRLSARGLGSLTPEEGLEALSRALGQPAPRVAVMRFAARQWREFFLSAASSPLLSQLQAASTSQPRAEGSIRQELLQRAPAERRSVLEQHVRGQIARVLQTPVTRVGLRTPFMQLGVDSLMAMEIRNRLEASLGMTLKVTLIWKHPTVSDLVTQLGREFGLPEAAAPAVGAAKTEAPPGQTAEKITQVLNLLKARKTGGTPGDGGMKHEQ